MATRLWTRLNTSRLSALLAPALVLLALTAAPSTSALAQEPPRQEKAEDKPESATAFEAAADGEVVKENLPAWPFLYGAYFLIMVVLMGYVTTLWVRQRKLDGEIARLDRKLDKIDEALGSRQGEG